MPDRPSPTPRLPELEPHSWLGPALRRWLLPLTMLLLALLGTAAAHFADRFDLLEPARADRTLDGAESEAGERGPGRP